MSDQTSPASEIHSGNYYGFGAERILRALDRLGIDYPATIAIDVPLEPALEESITSTPLTQALVHRFEGRDFECAQRLIHGPGLITRPEWHWIRIPDDNALGLSDRTFARSQTEAVAHIIGRCDAAGVAIQSATLTADGLSITTAQGETIGVTPVPLEPFSLSIRDRVRSALKHLKRGDVGARIIDRFNKLPGYGKATIVRNRPAASDYSCLMLAFPSNWSAELRSLLASLGVDVPLHQAQELTAAFFGAANWHQLTVHDDMPHYDQAPNAVCWLENGEDRCKVFLTTEEAVYFAGQLIGRWPSPLNMQQPNLSVSDRTILLSCWETSEDQVLISVGYEDSTSLDDEFYDPDALLHAATELIGAARAAESVRLYGNGTPTDLFLAAQQRAGIPASAVVQIGDFFLSFRMSKTPEERDWLSIYQFSGGTIELIKESIALYKADLVFTSSSEDRQDYLVIRGDYGHIRTPLLPVRDRQSILAISAILKSSVGLGLTAPGALGRIRLVDNQGQAHPLPDDRTLFY